MKILITGGTGYIGSYLATYFASIGYDVIVTLRYSDISYKKHPYRILNLNNLDSIDGICSNIDIVVHTATMDERGIIGQEKLAFEVNSFATRNLCLDAVTHKVKKFIYFSTFHVYGKSYGEIDEFTIPSPVSDYGITHYFAEIYLNQIAKNTQTDISAIRLTNGVGAPHKNVDKWYLVLNDFCISAVQNKKVVLKSDGLPLRDFVAIDDVVTAVHTLTNSNTAKNALDVFNLSSESTISMRDLALLVSDIYYEMYDEKITIEMPLVTEEKKAQVKPLLVKSQKLRELGWINTKDLRQVIKDIFNCIGRESIERNQ